jgi:hypothetical protein
MLHGLGCRVRGFLMLSNRGVAILANRFNLREAVFGTPHQAFRLVDSTRRAQFMNLTRDDFEAYLGN